MTSHKVKVTVIQRTTFILCHPRTANGQTSERFEVFFQPAAKTEPLSTVNKKAAAACLVTSADFDLPDAGFALDVTAPVIFAVATILNVDYLAPVATPTAH